MQRPVTIRMVKGWMPWVGACLAWVWVWLWVGGSELGAEPQEQSTSSEAAGSNHWSFQPLRSRHPEGAGTSGVIDQLVRERLQKEGLVMSAPADRLTWLRRVTLDLIGLPPTPARVETFLKDDRADARERVVEELLGSPRYGERWAQHWLDVVRYADTHGFEVNTERPNAWPYRDYVIEAFNHDTPYDRFIREQLVGDALGKDAATGFLITASVLLPGQIGADDVSKRLARQDALDEIVVNTSQTFLGLSVGCARCHDHKFDPITAADYYAMQSFFAGVEYGERELQTPELLAKRKAVEPLKTEIHQLEQRLAALEPVARPGSPPRRITDPVTNVETFAAVEARFVRFTIHDSNLHPTLGWIEPCLDEVEIFTDEPEPRNVALATHGTKVTASGSKTSGSHKVEHLNDGKYGNEHSWMSDQVGRGWVQLEFPEAVRISKLIWGRDREGKFKDRLPTAFSIETAVETNDWKRVVLLSPGRPMVSAKVNTDRFEPVKTKRVRLTIRQTNRLEPCVDELEVWDRSGKNIALASLGVKATSSGDTEVEGRHELKQVHDGRYGNGRSWMSNESGRGWVMLEFPEVQEVERVVWGRDREGVFSDRLATDYQVEVELEEGRGWKVVADSSDRELYEDNNGTPRAPLLQLAGLPEAQARNAAGWMEEKRRLEERVASESAGQMAFAGVFRKPDEIHRLMRGDPEQPREEVVPAVLKVLGKTQLRKETAEQERRRAIADWIASPSNPLTARVMVNRIWQGHFGVGLVDTANDFGRMGTKPTHPELLDWLAAEFLRSGGSVKHMHRLVVLSEVYGQSSRSREGAAAKDADARLLWRYPSRRLEAESIRDSMLWVSGRLNLKMGGRGFDLFNNRGGLSGFNPVESYSGEGLRRMIFAHKVRREREAVFGAFDCPDAGQSSARRRESTTPIQALNLFNSRFTLDESAALAARIESELGAGAAIELCIRRAYQRVLGREPARAEWEDALPVVREHGLPTLCRALYYSNEFLFIP